MRTQPRGFVTVILLLGILATAGAISAFLRIEVVRSRWSDDQVQQERAFALAEAGVDQVAALLNAGTWVAASTLQWEADGVDNDGDGLVDESDEAVLATSEIWGSDGIDNDGDAEVDEPDEDVVRVSCQAAVGRSERAVTAWLTRSLASLPEPAGAVYLNDPLAELTFNGNAFSISGTDTNLDGTAGPEGEIYGIAINGDPDQVIDQLGSQQLDNVTGLGADPSVGEETPNDPFFIESIVASLEASADLVFVNFADAYTGDLGDWTTGNYLITVSKGDFEVSGGGVGAGILLVDGNLTISGGWDYVGYVFVTGTVRMTGGGGTKRIRGALFVAGDVEELPATEDDLTITGTVDLLFSSQAIEDVQSALSRYHVVARTEP